VQRNTLCCGRACAAWGAALSLHRGPHPLAAHLAASWAAALETPDPQAQMQHFHAGIALYQAHSYTRVLPEMPVVAEAAGIMLRDYGPATGKPLLVIPSLVNPATVLDLTAETSLLRWLAGQGFRPLLVDWGKPTARTRHFSLDDYITKGLVPLLEGLCAPVAILGYCLGGTMAVALAALAPERVGRLALLAAPWDMTGYAADQRRTVAALWAQWQPRSAPLGAVPMEMLQLLFLGLDPALALRKFSRFATLDQAGATAAAFVALEDWANSGPPLALEVAAQLFGDWYESGGPARGWQIGDCAIGPTAHPALIVVSATDRIVPAAVTQPLADAWPGAQYLSVAAGHVGMVVGSRRQPLLWEPLRDFLM
jgi:polyhydroxyalkanoate synthase subunit PhaC